MLAERTAPRARRVLVLVCGDLETLGEGLDLRAIAERMAAPPALQVRRERDLCRRLGQAAVRLEGAEALVLGICSGDVPWHELQVGARKAGLDPFGVEVVNLGIYCTRAHPRREATGKARLLLAAAVAKTRAFAGSSPENVKPVLAWAGQVSRRAFLTLPPVRYQGVPSIRGAACAAGGGCRACAQVCRPGALQPAGDGTMSLDKARCTGCGACVTACPRDAMDLPGASLPQVGAQLAALLAADQGPDVPRGILFLCRGAIPKLDDLHRGGFAGPAAWLPVEVPSLGMVTAAWLLGCLAQGAAAVGLLPCSRPGCCPEQQDLTGGRADYCRELMRLLGEPGEPVRLLDPGDGAGLSRGLGDPPAGAMGRRAAPLQDDNLFASPLAAASSVLRLAAAAGAGLTHRLAHSHSPLGVVRLREGACTGCEACVRACPAGALACRREGGGMVLTFDARRCVACMACAPACPEHALSVERITDLARLSQGVTTLFQDAEPRCEACGAPIAPRALLRRLQALLADQPGAAAAIARWCSSCRGMAPGSAWGR